MILPQTSSASGSKKKQFHRLRYQNIVRSCVLMSSKNRIVLIGSAILSYCPCTNITGGVLIVPQRFSEILYMSLPSWLRVPAQTFQWNIYGWFSRQLDALGLLVTRSYIQGNSPVRLGTILRAMSEMAISTALMAGFFRVVEVRIRPASLSYLCCWQMIRASRDPSPCPNTKTGKLPYISNTLVMNRQVSFNMSSWSSMYPRSPSDLPCPRWSNPTTVYPCWASTSATEPMMLVDSPKLCSNTTTALGLAA